MAAATSPDAPAYNTPSAVDKAEQEKSGDSRDWWGLTKNVFSSFSEDKAITLAAALSLYTILSLGPLLVIAWRVVSVVYWRSDQNAKEQVQTQATQLIGPAGGSAISEMLARGGTEGGSGTIATIVSAIILLFTASGVFAQLQDSMNTIWEVKPKPNAGWWQTIKKRLFSMAMVFGIIFLLMVSMFVSAFLTTMSRRILGEHGWLSIVLDVILSTAVSFVLFASIFKFVPDAKVRWKDVWVGGLVTAILFTIGRYALSIYFKFSATESTYGAFGSIIAVLLWAYYSSMILFLGAEFTQVWARRHGRPIKPDDDAVQVTEEERAQRGLTSPDRLAQAERENRGHRPRPQPKYLRPPANLMTPGAYPGNGHGGMSATQIAMAAGGLLVGAVAGVLGAEYLLHDPRKPTRKQAAAVRLNDRIDRVEEKIGRVSRLKHYLEEMDVKERIDRVEKEILRAGRHVRAEETGRPMWMVRLADMIGGRWSNLQPTTRSKR